MNTTDVKRVIAQSSAFIFSLLSGVSVFYFLYVFGAYGIQRGVSYSGHSHFVRSFSFGLLTFAYILVCEKWLKPTFKISGHKREFMWYMTLVFIGIQLVFILFNYFWNWQEWNLLAYFLIAKEFPLMMVFALLFYGVFRVLIKDVETQKALLLFQSVNTKDQLKIKPEDFLYANSSENYITIVYRAGGHSRKHLIRKPMKVLEEELVEHTDIVRNHRSYMVNRLNVQNIKKVKGKVELEIGGEILPVSKQYEHYFMG
ncbi:hypothetical protein GC194_10625 [bacterium]|nr:hypothetical protein [bacterium]